MQICESVGGGRRHDTGRSSRCEPADDAVPGGRVSSA